MVLYLTYNLLPLVLCPWFSAKCKTVCIHTPLKRSFSSFKSEGGDVFSFFFFLSAMLNTNNDNSDRFNIGKCHLVM